MKSIKLQNLVFVLALTLLGFACDNSSTGPGENELAMVNGKVENNESNKADASKAADIEGVIVTAATLNADGSLETISGAEAETDADGEFTLEIDVEAVSNATNRVVVTAEQNGETIKAFVSQELQSGGEATVQPLTFESTAETEVFAEVVANGDADFVSQAEIEATVSSSMATELRGNTQAASSLAVALAEKAQAQSEFYAEQGVEFSEEQQDEASGIKAEAMAELEAQLDAATNQEDKETALSVFTEKVAKAHVQAGVNASAGAKSSELSSRVLVNNSTELSSSARSELRKNIASMLSFTVDAAVRAQMEAVEASESSLDAAADAAVDLRTEIKSMASASKEDIDAAFETYNGAIIDILQNEFSASASAFAEVNSAINETGGAKATLEAALGATVDTSTMIDAYAAFFSSVQTLADASFTSAGETEAEAFTQVMILINLAS